MTQFRPMRFLHAAGLMLERPLLETGELAGDLAKTAAHATLFAWERLVDLAIAKDVDFVLLTGETFDFREASLAAEVAFRQGAQRLDAKEIPLIIAPGQLDSASGWAAIPALPENVTLFEHAEDPAIDLTVGGQTYCAIVPITDSTSVDPPELERLRARVPKKARSILLSSGLSVIVSPARVWRKPGPRMRLVDMCRFIISRMVAASRPSCCRSQKGSCTPRHYRFRFVGVTSPQVPLWSMSIRQVVFS